MIRSALFFILVCSGHFHARAATWEFTNITKHDYSNACFRLPVDPPAGECRVTMDGKALPAVVDDLSGEMILWTRASIAPGARVTFDISPGKPGGSRSGVHVKMDGDFLVPDTSYPFGEIPDWLVRKRSTLPDWAPEWAKRMRAGR